MRKQLRIGILAVIILLVLETVRHWQPAERITITVVPVGTRLLGEQPGVAQSVIDQLSAS
jgi:hypothetical protein